MPRDERGPGGPGGPSRVDSPLTRLHASLLRRRDRLVASPRFQHAAARFLPTRWIARRRARELFDLVAGFTYSQVLLACVQLRLFDWLLERPRTATEFVEYTRLDRAAVDRLVAAAIALRLLERRAGGHFGLGRLGAPLAGNGAIVAMVEHHAALYADLADPVALLRRPAASSTATRLGRVWGYATAADPAALDDDRVRDYSRLMTASQPLVADQVLDAYPMGGHRCHLDVGGGEGGFAMAVARRHPQLAVRVFDLPAVAARARAGVAAAGLSDRVMTFGGDFARDPLPSGADLITLVRVVHDHDDAQVLVLLRAVHAALPPGGVLLLAEPMAGTAGAERMGDAYFGMYLLAMGSGRPRSAATLSGLLAAAGFRDIEQWPTPLPLQTRVLSARR